MTSLDVAFDKASYETMQETSPPPFPTEGWRADGEDFVEIEAAVREALPSAPRMLQVLLAGAAFTNIEGRDSGTDSYYEHNMRAKGIEAEDAINAERLIFERFSGDKPKPFLELTDLYKADDSKKPQTNQRLAAKAFYKAVEPYVDYLIRWQPLFIAEDILSGYDELDAKSILNTDPLAEPVRNPDLLPQRPYTDHELYEFGQNLIKQWQEFDLSSGEIEGWADIAEEVQQKLDKGKVVVLTAPQGSGKSNYLVPILAETAEQTGRAVIYNNQRRGNLAEMIAEQPKDKPVLIIQDEIKHNAEAVADTISVFSLSRDVQAVILAGGSSHKDIALSKARSIASTLDSKPNIKTETVSAFDRELLVSDKTVDDWGVELGLDEELREFIKQNKFLKIPRVFTSLFLRATLDPTNDKYRDKSSDDAISDIIDSDVRFYGSGVLKSRRHPSRPVANIRSLDELKAVLDHGEDKSIFEVAWSQLGLTQEDYFDMYVETYFALGIQPKDASAMQRRA